MPLSRREHLKSLLSMGSCLLNFKMSFMKVCWALLMRVMMSVEIKAVNLRAK